MNLLQDNVSLSHLILNVTILCPQDRNLRRQALVEFNKVCEKEKSDEIWQFFFREKLVRRLIIVLEDPIEKNREFSIDIMVKSIERIGLKDEAMILLPAIANRMNKVPFAETCKCFYIYFLLFVLRRKSE